MRTRLLLLLIPLVLLGCERDDAALAPAPPADDAAIVRGALSGEADEGFRRVLAPRPFRFPRDHGAHPDYRSEWWYFTGNLDDAAGRRYGFQLTFFRFALAARQARAAIAADAEPPSAWRTRQVWMAHFALTDVDGQRFHAFERFARGANGLAGARDDRLMVWLEDWSAGARESEGDFPLRLIAREAGVSLELELSALKPIVLQGDRGFSAKSDAPGNASHYYSFTRLDARGEIELEGERREVRGLAWLDREWSTSALAEDQTGWDWFALQLDDGRDLMFYRLRASDGSTHPSSAGVLVSADGEATRLVASDIQLEPGERWRASSDVGGYPIAWRLRGLGLDLEVTALLAAQAHAGRFRYWEGAVEVRGVEDGRALGGRGYLEMTPYPARAGGV